jgi:hypothetical protein
VPKRLCSISCRVLERLSKPAKTLGFAAASITQSAADKFSTSLAQRMSPWMTPMPSRLRFRFASLPERIKLSTPKTSASSFAALIRLARALPTKPQIPVMRTFMNGNGVSTTQTESSQILWFSRSMGNVFRLSGLRGALPEEGIARRSERWRRGLALWRFNLLWENFVYADTPTRRHANATKTNVIFPRVRFYLG